MAIGISVTKADLDRISGALARDVNNLLRWCADFDEFLDAKAEGELTALGYTAGEVAVIKSAFADLAQLASLYDGVGTLANAKDFTTFAKQLWGTGVPV